MTNPPEWDDTHRSETQRLADDIATACRGIRHNWPHMLRAGETQAPGRATTSGVNLDDHSPSSVDTNRVTRTISLRRFAMDQLNAWSRAIIDDRDITNAATLPLGTDVPAMAQFIERHADWLSGQDYGPDCRDEVRDLNARCANTAFPKRRESISLGRCPLETPGELDVLAPCPGTIRYRLHHDDNAGEAMAVCDHCGEAAVISWWEHRMFDDPETQRTLDADGVVALIHQTWGDVVKPSTVRQWVKRGILEPSETSDGQRSLFDRDAVVYAYDRWKRRADLNA